MTVLASTTTRRRLTRRTVGALAAVALGTGLAAVGTGSADAATRRATDLGTGQVTSTVVGTVTGTGAGLAVRSAVGPLEQGSYVETTLNGKVTAACFADGAVVRGSGVSLGWVRTGDLGGNPFYNDGSYVDTVVEPSTTSGTVSADVVLKGILRDRAGQLDQLDCAEGQTAGWYRYRVTSVASARHTFDGTVTGTFSAPQTYSYYFPAPLV
ncbi:hypothetical protein [Kineococcus aurantiacus]|uniref:Tat pathway signal sequence domain protein n=1 Tax=Kineococcus aurantiacus TaxID=37633 RepID=A0A7Y9DJH0_9ACTN|nr:hypothetical protein [Kineococcus aurantiacus]NYD20907.1 hypothetical protein [Kineococcus aurantiacus]